MRRCGVSLLRLLEYIKELWFFGFLSVIKLLLVNWLLWGIWMILLEELVLINIPLFIIVLLFWLLLFPGCGLNTFLNRLWSILLLFCRIIKLVFIKGLTRNLMIQMAIHVPLNLSSFWRQHSGV